MTDIYHQSFFPGLYFNYFPEWNFRLQRDSNSGCRSWSLTTRLHHGRPFLMKNLIHFHNGIRQWLGTVNCFCDHHRSLKFFQTIHHKYLANFYSKNTNIFSSALRLRYLFLTSFFALFFFFFAISHLFLSILPFFSFNSLSNSLIFIYFHPFFFPLFLLFSFSLFFIVMQSFCLFVPF